MICKNDDCRNESIHEEGVLCRFKGKPRGKRGPLHHLRMLAGRMGVSFEEYMEHTGKGERRCSVCKQWMDEKIHFWERRDQRQGWKCKACARKILSTYGRSPEGTAYRRAYDREYKARKRMEAKLADDAEDVHQQHDRAGDGQDDQETA